MNIDSNFKAGVTMVEFSLKLNLLSDILERKKKALEQILNITENQEVVLNQGKSSELVDMFNEMAGEKQKYVEIVLQADILFQKTFGELKSYFESMAEQHLKEIKILQTQISSIMDLDVAIRVKEKRNKELADSRRSVHKIQTPKVSKNYMLQQYENNKKNKD